MNNHRKKIWQKNIKDFKNESSLRKKSKQAITNNKQNQEKKKLLSILNQIKKENIRDPLETIKEQNNKKKQLKIKEWHRLYGKKSIIEKPLTTKINKTYTKYNIFPTFTTQKVNNRYNKNYTDEEVS